MTAILSLSPGVVRPHIALRRMPRWSLAASLATALLGFLYCGPLLRTMDAAAAPVDPGILSLLVLAVLALILFACLSLWLLELVFPVFRTYRRYHFANNFKSLLPWQKVVVYLAALLFLLLAWVLCLCTVM